MPKARTTLTIDEDILRAVRVRGARTGKGDSQVIEDALRRELGFDLLDRLWQRGDLGEDEARAFLELLRDAAVLASDPAAGSHQSSDPGDNYLLALAEAERAILVTGDAHLLVLADELPIVTARSFVESLAADIR